MAVTMQSPRYSKKMIFNLTGMIMLGWLVMIGWAMTWWVRLGFEAAQQHMHHLMVTQRAVITDYPAIPTIKLDMNHLTGKIKTLGNGLPSPNSEFVQIARDGLQTARQFWQLVVLASQIILIKLLILICALPLFLLTMTAGLVDGLNQRAIRTASLGRESSYVFHQLNRLFRRMLTAALGIWLVIPVCMTPALMLIPVSILASIMVSLTASRFKKYL